jgi:hypothetical protein
MPRKKKKNKENVNDNDGSTNTNPEANIQLEFVETTVENPPPPPKKKRGRKPKKKDANYVKPPPKKRGRKPKGGKIVSKNKVQETKFDTTNQNIILHLKCNSKDLDSDTFISLPKYNPDVGLLEPSSYTFNNKVSGLNYEEIDAGKKKTNNNTENIVNSNSIEQSKKVETETNMKNIWEKLNKLKMLLRNNNITEKNSSCFWCTYDFDTPNIYIPKNYNGNKLEVYGCFCSPECAVSYLKNENLDDSTKWERYALLNNIYSEIYEYEKNIKPAPNPHYTLDKFYGSLNIKEYRKLLHNDSILLVANKPMTKILPELFEENNELPKIYDNLVNVTNSNIKTNTYRLQRNKVVNTKNNILSNNFNLVK